MAISIKKPGQQPGQYKLVNPSQGAFWACYNGVLSYIRRQPDAAGCGDVRPVDVRVAVVVVRLG